MLLHESTVIEKSCCSDAKSMFGINFAVTEEFMKKVFEEAGRC